MKEREKMKIVSKEDYQNAKMILNHDSSMLDDLDKNLCNGIIISHLRGEKMPAYQLMNFRELVKNELSNF
jgi:hypothetical protein